MKSCLHWILFFLNENPRFLRPTIASPVLLTSSDCGATKLTGSTWTSWRTTRTSRTSRRSRRTSSRKASTIFQKQRLYTGRWSFATLQSTIFFVFLQSYKNLQKCFIFRNSIKFITLFRNFFNWGNKKRDFLENLFLNFKLNDSYLAKKKKKKVNNNFSKNFFFVFEL